MSTNDIQFNKVSGQIEIIDKDNHSYTIILNDYIGSIDVSPIVKRLRFILHGESDLESAIELSSPDKLDSISIRGEGYCSFPSLKATVVEILGDVEVNIIDCHIAKITSAKLSTSTYLDWINASSHIWITDSVLECTTSRVGIKSPYVLIDNSNVHLECNIPIDSDNPASLEHVLVDEDTEHFFICKGKVLDKDGDPRSFVQTAQETRRTLYNHTPAVLASPKDKFKQSTGYSNPNLHRHIDQEGSFEDPEDSSKTYDAGIYGLYSIRTTSTHYYGDGSLINEIP